MRWIFLATLSLLFASNASALDVAGKTYVLVTAQGHELPRDSVRFGFIESKRVGFENQISFHAGCNSYWGNYELVDGALVVPGLGQTEMACRGPEGAQESWLAKFVMSQPRIRYDAKRLTLENDEAKLEFLIRQLASPDRPIVGTVWSVHRLIKTARSGGFILKPEPTMVFAKDGTVRVTTGCNEGRGRYTKEGPKKLSLQAVSFGKKQCKGTLGFADRHLQTLFASSTLTFRIDERSLSMMGPGRLGVDAAAP